MCLHLLWGNVIIIVVIVLVFTVIVIIFSIICPFLEKDYMTRISPKECRRGHNRIQTSIQTDGHINF